MSQKGLFISVCVTHEGEQGRTTPYPPASPTASNLPTMWVGCDSCHILGFPLSAGTFNGNVYPQVVIEGSRTDLTEPITINSNNSFLGQAVVDSSGNLYSLNFYVDDAPGTTITFYVSPAQRNTLPVRTIGGNLTTLPAQGSGILRGGLCIDTAQDIWALCGGTLLEFAPSANGNVTASHSYNVSTTVGALNYCLFWDAARSLIWAVGNTPCVAAYDTSGVQQRLISGSSTTLAVNIKSVAVDSSGLIYVANDYGGVTSSVAVFAATAGTTGSQNVAPIQTISGAATFLDAPQSITVYNGMIYVGDIGVGTGAAQGNFPRSGAFYSNCIFAWPTGTTGNVAPTTIVQGAKAEIDFMADGAGSGPVSLIVGATSAVPVPYHPPATRFTTASMTVTGMSLPASSRYGALMNWSFASVPGASVPIFQDLDGHGFTLAQNSAGARVLKLFDATGSIIATATESTARDNTGVVWYQDLISWDTLAQNLQWYLSGFTSANLAVTWASTNPVAYPSADNWQFGSTGQDILVSDFWFNVPGSTFSLSANVSNFAANGDTMSGVVYCYPVNISTGLGPTGLIYFTGNGTSYAVNRGTAGGGITTSGTLSDGQNTP